MHAKKNSNHSVRLPLYISIAICVGVFIGANMAGTPTKSSNFIQSLAKFRQVLTFIENDYVDDVNSDKLVENAIKSMLKDLDPHRNLHRQRLG